MKTILGLDLGTNSIGWALVEIDHEKKIVRIIGLGSRVIPMNGGEISKFENGNILKSAASKKTTDKRVRTTKGRYLLRRDRLHTLLNLLKALPEHYSMQIDFERNGKRCGKFKKGTEPKLAYYTKDNGKKEFYFMDAYREMEQEFRQKHPGLPISNKKGKPYKLPYDWTLYYLRKKALASEVTLEELSWILLSYNQKRGYEKVRGLNEGEEEEKEKFLKTVENVTEIEKGKFKVKLKNNFTEQVDFTYFEETGQQITEVGDIKEIEKVKGRKEYKIQQILKLKVEEVSKAENDSKGNDKYKIVYENGWVQYESSKYKPKWEGELREIITEVIYNNAGEEIKAKDGSSKRSIKSPKQDDWKLRKLRDNNTIKDFIAKNKRACVSSYIYAKLLKNPQIKLKGSGGLLTVIDRDFYRKEIDQIIKKQKQFHTKELDNPELFQKAIQLLYPKNESHKKKLEKLDMCHLITDDVLLYQRDLKSKKSEIGECRYEWSREVEFFNTVKQEKEKKKLYLKAIHKSNPYYQEYRVWDLIKRIKIFKINETEEDEDVTENKMPIGDKLFEYLNDRQSINEYDFLKHLKLSEKEYRWNLTKRGSEEENNPKAKKDDEFKANKKDKIPCNETHYLFINRIEKVKEIKNASDFLTQEIELKLWHFFYSVKGKEYKKGLKTLFEKIGQSKGLLEEAILELVKNFETFPSFKNDYANYSEKAIKKLLPFMRIGKYWDEEEVKSILSKAEEKFNKESANNKLMLNREARLQKVKEKEGINGEVMDFQGLNVSSACYLVYGFFSEVGEVKYWKHPKDIESFLRNEFKQHSMKNPVVEKVLVETLQLVKAIWEHKDFGNSQPNYFTEIHLELARKMKQNAKQRKKASSVNLENKKTNQRIKKLLVEIKKEVEDVNPSSSTHQERLKILEEGTLSSIKYDKDEVEYEYRRGRLEGQKISKKELKQIKKRIAEDKIKNSDFERYKLWLDQRYQSPYTGKFIKLSDLFNREKYEVDHIFPRERVNLDAFYNKVICETEINKKKGARTGYEFILDSAGEATYCEAHAQKTTVSNPDNYLSHARSNYQGRKKEILMSKDIPKKFSNAQLNNTRYISKAVMGILSNIVRRDDPEKKVIDNGFKSVNLIPVNGQVTDILKKDWRLNDTWNTIIEPRFRRLNELTNSNKFGDEDIRNGHKFFRNTVPEEFEDDFDKKRLDHRHHALDALVVALTTLNHTNYLNNVFSLDKKSKERFDLRNKLTAKRKVNEQDTERYFLAPLQEFKEDESVQYFYKNNERKRFAQVVLDALQHIVVSYKKNNRIINKSSNKTWQWQRKENGRLLKKLVPQLESIREAQKNGYNWNIRRRMNEDTFHGEVKLQSEVEAIDIQKKLEYIYSNINLIVSQKQREVLAEAKEKELSASEVKTQINSKTVELYKSYVAVRKNLTPSIKIEDITDESIQKILTNHLEQEAYQNKTDDDGKLIPPKDLAFSPEGIKEMNANIKILNGGKDHKPIYKVRLKEAKGKKFPQGETGNKTTKFVDAAAGSNNYLGVYQDKNANAQKRLFKVPTLAETIESLKQKERRDKTFLSQTEYDKKQNRHDLLFELSPNDLVYVPTREELENPELVQLTLTQEQVNRVYVVIDFGEGYVNFVQHHIAKPIYAIDKKKFDKVEQKMYSSGRKFVNEVAVTDSKNKKRSTMKLSTEEGRMIKDSCWKLEADRLGHITKIIK